MKSYNNRASMPNTDLRNADCLDTMANVSPGSVSVVVTSPPYNIGTSYSNYNDNMPREDYLKWLGQWAGLVHKILAQDGSLFLNLGSKPSDPCVAFDVLRVVQQAGFYLQNTIHWIKAITVNGKSSGHYKPINSPRYLNDCHEYVFYLTKSNCVVLDRLAIGAEFKDKANITRWKNGDGRNVRCRGNTWFIPYETIQNRKKDRPHPATFPVTLPLWCLKLHGVDRCQLVVDPFMGSGSTALACIELGLNFLGVDIDEDSYELARTRVIQTQPTLEAHGNLR